jgi:hypothetical protein
MQVETLHCLYRWRIRDFHLQLSSLHAFSFSRQVIFRYSLFKRLYKTAAYYLKLDGKVLHVRDTLEHP